MLTGFQFNSAKLILELTACDIGNAIGLHENTILKYANSRNLDLLKGHSNNLKSLKNFFESKNILFIEYDSISLKNNLIEIPITQNLTKFQLKIARVTAGLSQEELSTYIDISSSTLSMVESVNIAQYVKLNQVKIDHLKTYFKHLGIVFPNDLTVQLLKDPFTILGKKLKSG